MPLIVFDPALVRIAPPPGTERMGIFMDESSTGGCRYVGFGGLWIPDSCEASLRAAIAEVRASAGMRAGGEFKWGKVSGKTPHPAYIPLVDAFFNAKGCRFNALVVDSRNPGRNRGQDRELDYYKNLHWLVRKRVRPAHAYRVVLDHLTNKGEDRLTDLRNVLNNSARKDHAISYDCVREVVARDSKDEPLIQLADVLLGAVCFHANERHLLRAASRSKCIVAAHIAKRAGFRSSITATYPSEIKFNVWLWQPQRGRID